MKRKKGDLILIIFIWDRQIKILRNIEEEKDAGNVSARKFMARAPSLIFMIPCLI